MRRQSRQRKHPFRITRHGNPIEQHGIKDSVQTGISYSFAYEEFNAVIETGLDPEKYLAGGYSIELLSWCVAFVRSKSQIKLHSEDAVSRKMASKAKK